MSDFLLRQQAAARKASGSRLARSSLTLLIALQLLLISVVVTAVLVTSAYLQRLALNNMQSHAEVQVHNLEERLTQSFDLLHTHLQGLMSSNLANYSNREWLENGLWDIQLKLPYVRSLSVMDRNGRIFASTNGQNIGLRPALDSLLPKVSGQAIDLLRFAQPWLGRDFADGRPLQDEMSVGRIDLSFFPALLTPPMAPQLTYLIAINSDYFVNLAPGHEGDDPLVYRTWNDDGVLLFSTAETDKPGNLFPRAKQLGEILARPARSGLHTMDEEQLLVAYRTSRHYPWFIEAEIPARTVLQQWRQNTIYLWLITVSSIGVLLLVTGFLTLRVRRSLMREGRYLEDQRLAANVFHHSSDLIAITDAKLRIITVNPAFEKVSGYLLSEVQGVSIGRLHVSAEQSPAFNELRHKLKTQDRWEGEIYETRKDGSRMVGWLTVNAIHDQNDKPVSYVCVLHDLSAIRASEATIRRLSLVVEQSPSSIVITTTEPAIEYANPEFFRVTGYNRQEVIGANPRILQSGQTAPSTYREMWNTLTAGDTWHGEFVNRRKDGSIYYEREVIGPLKEPDDTVTGYLAIKHDITREKEAEKNMRLAASVIAATREGVIVCDENEIIIEVNPAFCEISGYSREEAIGRTPEFLSAGDKPVEQQAQVSRQLKAEGYWQGEFWNRRKNGSRYAIMCTITAVRSEQGVITHYVSMFSDITELKNYHDELEQRALFDGLTGLANRSLLQERMQKAMASQCDRRGLLAVCFIDLDGFKQVNDLYGHDAGDELLIVIARRLEQQVRANDTVARLGGDEFVVLLNPVAGVDECAHVAQRLLDVIAEPVRMPGHHQLAQVSGSIGIALYPMDNSNLEDLLQHADQAMYQAKQGGRNRYVFHAASLPLRDKPVDPPEQEGDMPRV